MGPTQGPALTDNVAEMAELSPASFVDSVPVFVRELVAGGVSGAFSKTAIAPLERVKIILQTRMEGYQSLGMLKSLRKLRNHEGVLGFYKGNGASVIRIVPYAALHFMAYERYRCWILNNCSFLGTGPLVDLLAGSAAGGTAVLCTYPLDLARTKLAYQVVNRHDQYQYGGRILPSKPSYNGIKDVLTSVYKEGQIRALYRGVGPTLVGILPYAGLKFYIFEELKTHVSQEYRQSVSMHLACGGLAGLLGQTFTYPLDVVRRQMQVQSMVSADDPAKVKSTIQGLSLIARTQGWKQLFAGLSINYVKVVPSVAIGFTTYEMMKSWLRVPGRER